MVQFIDWITLYGDRVLDVLALGTFAYIILRFGVTFYNLDRYVPARYAWPLKRIVFGHQLILVVMLGLLMRQFAWYRAEEMPPIMAFVLAPIGMVAIASVANIGERIQVFVLDPIERSYHPQYTPAQEDGAA